MFIRQTFTQSFRWRASVRFSLAMLGIFACCWLLVGAAKSGLSRFFSAYGVRAELAAPVEMAEILKPDDPEIHRARALLYEEAGDHIAAARKLEQALAMRPRDPFLWVELGLARDQAGETEQAIIAFQKATQLAPYYAQSRWQLGNLLLRAGRYGEAFAEIRGAVASNPTLFPNAIDLAYGIYGGDAVAVESAIRPDTHAAKLALARTYARRGNAEDTLRVALSLERLSGEQRQKLVTDLLEARQFSAAFDIWASGGETSRKNTDVGRESIVDGGFEAELRTSELPSFGWRIERELKGVKAFLGKREPRSGNRHLILDWSGDPAVWTPAMSQLIMVAPGKSYRLSFWARSEDLVTAGAPIVTITDAAKNELPLGQSPPLTQANGQWRQYFVQFETGANTQAVQLAVRREFCASTPCPIFGQLWLDDFALNNR